MRSSSFLVSAALLIGSAIDVLGVSLALVGLKAAADTREVHEVVVGEAPWL